jgi:uncharacterized protein (DUF1697 family)
VSRYAALLRGINMGGHNRLPMEALRKIFAAAGCTRVETYIQSGNVVFGSSTSLARKLPALVSAAIEREFGYRIPVMLRSAADLARIAASHPFEGSGVGAGFLHVVFLAAAPDPALVAALDPDRSPPDRFAILGQEIFLCCPNGAADTKLTNAWFDSRLKTVTTARNWRTVLKLAEMTR